MAAKSTRLILDHALLPGGWAENVAVDIDQGVIRSLAAGASREQRERVPGIALPGLPNLHSHAFQRGMAGLAEVRGPTSDSFWTWRQVMYRFLAALDPEDVEAIAAFAYMEMIEAGFTAVGEFHYIHHAPDGSAYADLAELGGRIVSAARSTGIGLTLIPSFYANGGFGGAAPTEGQRRFVNDPERFGRLVEATRVHLSELSDAALAIAPHSLRAVTPGSLAEVLAEAPPVPVHIHAAEQEKEVADCRAWSGRRPVAWLLENCAIDPRWCLIHATHMDETETRALARSRAVAGLCPITEASLGDGIFEGRLYLAESGRLGVGTDSNVEITAPGELRQLEYGQRLKHRERNVTAGEPGQSTGRRLYEAALAGGAQALGRAIGSIAVGRRADLVVLDYDHPDFVGRVGDQWIDAYVFAVGRSAIRSVIIGGERVVDEGRHRARGEIVADYRAAIGRIAAERV